MISIQTICIAGCGVMGRQVAWACARAGIRTILFDRDARIANSAADRIREWLADAMESPGEIIVAESLRTAVAEADLIFENIFEDIAIKQALYRQIEALDNGRKLIGSNASSLSWTSLASGLRWPSRFFLLNFSGPRHSRLAEYMEGPATAPAVREAVIQWTQRIDIIAVPVRKDSPGYAQNRIWRAIKKEALRLVDQGYSTPDDIDRGFILSFGVRHGPFAIMDMVGLQTVLRIEQRYHDLSGDPADAPPKLLFRLVEAGRFGVATGSGFYDYPDPRYEQQGWLEGKTGQKDF